MINPKNNIWAIRNPPNAKAPRTIPMGKGKTIQIFSISS